MRFWAPVSRARSPWFGRYDSEDTDNDCIIFIARCTEQIVWVGNFWYTRVNKIEVNEV